MITLKLGSGIPAVVTHRVNRKPDEAIVNGETLDHSEIKIAGHNSSLSSFSREESLMDVNNATHPVSDKTSESVLQTQATGNHENSGSTKRTAVKNTKPAPPVKGAAALPKRKGRVVGVLGNTKTTPVPKGVAALPKGKGKAAGVKGNKTRSGEPSKKSESQRENKKKKKIPLSKNHIGGKNNEAILEESSLFGEEEGEGEGGEGDVIGRGIFVDRTTQRDPRTYLRYPKPARMLQGNGDCPYVWILRRKGLEFGRGPDDVLEPLGGFQPCDITEGWLNKTPFVDTKGQVHDESDVSPDYSLQRALLDRIDFTLSTSHPWKDPLPGGGASLWIRQDEGESPLTQDAFTESASEDEESESKGKTEEEEPRSLNSSSIGDTDNSMSSPGKVNRDRPRNDPLKGKSGQASRKNRGNDKREKVAQQRKNEKQKEKGDEDGKKEKEKEKQELEKKMEKEKADLEAKKAAFEKKCLSSRVRHERSLGIYLLKNHWGHGWYSESTALRGLMSDFMQWGLEMSLSKKPHVVLGVISQPSVVMDPAVFILSPSFHSDLTPFYDQLITTDQKERIIGRNQSPSAFRASTVHDGRVEDLEREEGPASYSELVHVDADHGYYCRPQDFSVPWVNNDRFQNREISPTFVAQFFPRMSQHIKPLFFQDEGVRSLVKPTRIFSEANFSASYNSLVNANERPTYAIHKPLILQESLMSCYSENADMFQQRGAYGDRGARFDGELYDYTAGKTVLGVPLSTETVHSLVPQVQSTGKSAMSSLAAFWSPPPDTDTLVARELDPSVLEENPFAAWAPDFTMVDEKERAESVKSRKQRIIHDRAKNKLMTVANKEQEDNADKKASSSSSGCCSEPDIRRDKKDEDDDEGPSRLAGFARQITTTAQNLLPYLQEKAQEACEGSQPVSVPEQKDSEPESFALASACRALTSEMWKEFQDSMDKALKSVQDLRVRMGAAFLAGFTVTLGYCVYSVQNFPVQSLLHTLMEYHSHCVSNVQYGLLTVDPAFDILVALWRRDQLSWLPKLMRSSILLEKKTEKIHLQKKLTQAVKFELMKPGFTAGPMRVTWQEWSGPDADGTLLPFTELGVKLPYDEERVIISDFENSPPCPGRFSEVCYGVYMKKSLCFGQDYLMVAVKKRLGRSIGVGMCHFLERFAKTCSYVTMPRVDETPEVGCHLKEKYLQYTAKMPTKSRDKHLQFYASLEDSSKSPVLLKDAVFVKQDEVLLNAKGRMIINPPPNVFYDLVAGITEIKKALKSEVFHLVLTKETCDIWFSYGADMDPEQKSKWMAEVRSRCHGYTPKMVAYLLIGGDDNACVIHYHNQIIAWESDVTACDQSHGEKLVRSMLYVIGKMGCPQHFIDVLKDTYKRPVKKMRKTTVEFEVRFLVWQLHTGHPQTSTCNTLLVGLMAIHLLQLLAFNFSRKILEWPHDLDSTRSTENFLDTQSELLGMIWKNEVHLDVNNLTFHKGCWLPCSDDAYQWVCLPSCLWKAFKIRLDIHVSNTELLLRMAFNLYQKILNPNMTFVQIMCQKQFRHIFVHHLKGFLPEELAFEIGFSMFLEGKIHYHLANMVAEMKLQYRNKSGEIEAIGPYHNRQRNWSEAVEEEFCEQRYGCSARELIYEIDQWDGGFGDWNNSFLQQTIQRDYGFTHKEYDEWLLTEERSPEQGFEEI